MSREALSLEISQVVSRVVGGEAVDTFEEGIELALKYPDLGMTGEMITEAIGRAAGMVGMIKATPMPEQKRSWAKPTLPPMPAAELGEVGVPLGVNGAAENSAPGVPEAMEGEIADRIDTEIGRLISGEVARRPANGASAVAISAAAAKASRPRFSPVARLRALFRH